MNNTGYDSVADSTDWLPTPLSGLSAVEAALRCQICKDFYKTPMLTSCNHTFCSLCIRRALSADGKCPLCRASEQEMKLRSNWSMEEVVAAFTQTRAAVLEFARRPPSPSPSPSPSPATTSTISDAPKRRVGYISIDDDDSEPSSKRLRSSTRLSKTRGMEATAEMARLESDIPDTEPMNIEPDDGLVACPICWKRMKPVQVDRHIDSSCPGPQPCPPPPPRLPSYGNPPKSIRMTGTPSTSSSRTRFHPPTISNKPQPPLPTPDRLPTLNYSMLKETHLRKELNELGLSNSGNRAMLERRHREWVMIWNANCDSQRPRRRIELLHDLDVWERTLGSRAPVLRGAAAAANNTGIRDKDFDGAAWAVKYDSSYRDLIENARRTRAQTRASKIETETKEKDKDKEKDNGVDGLVTEASEMDVMAQPVAIPEETENPVETPVDVPVMLEPKPLTEPPVITTIPTQPDHEKEKEMSTPCLFVSTAEETAALDRQG
ncbi:DNA repair protein rad18 [Xylaria sp. CBS 124048]|nr:DNA repair protein rad18 [Xylaria sp. CBS 124048]